MNSAVIVKLEYRFPTTAEFTAIAYQGFSANLKEQISPTAAGNLHQATIQFRVPQCTAANDALLLSLSQRRAIYRATDANGSVYQIGDAKRGATLIYSRAIDGRAGGYNGYDVVITRKFKGAALIL